jgi:hypothetical protein
MRDSLNPPPIQCRTQQNARFRYRRPMGFSAGLSLTLDYWDLLLLSTDSRVCD